MLHVLCVIFYSRSLSSVCFSSRGGGSTLPGDPPAHNMKFFSVDYSKNSVSASDIPNGCSRKSRYMNKWRMRVGGKVQDHCVGREDNGRHYVEMREVGLHIYMCEIDISWPVAVSLGESLTSLQSLGSAPDWSGSRTTSQTNYRHPALIDCGIRLQNESLFVVSHLLEI